MILLLFIAVIFALLTVVFNLHSKLRRYFPSNIVRDRVWTRDGLKWGVPAMLLATPYFAVAYWLASLIENGGPGWLNIFLFLCLWSMFKLVLLGPISLVMLAYVRVRETIECHRERATTNGFQAERGSETVLSGVRQ